MAHDYAKAFYNSKEWIKCRDAFMESKHYICERCGRPAVICHHKKHITPQNINDPDITLNWDNLQALCIDCHNVVHGNSMACMDGLSFDSEGNLKYTPQGHEPSGGPQDQRPTSENLHTSFVLRESSNYYQ